MATGCAGPVQPGCEQGALDTPAAIIGVGGGPVAPSETIVHEEGGGAGNRPILL